MAKRDQGGAILGANFRRVGRRDLGEEPQVLDDAVGGHRLLAVGPHHLVLPEGARHFHPVVRCAKCRNPFISFQHEVHSRADLHLGDRLCESCADASLLASDDSLSSGSDEALTAWGLTPAGDLLDPHDPLGAPAPAGHDRLDPDLPSGPALDPFAPDPGQPDDRSLAAQVEALGRAVAKVMDRLDEQAVAIEKAVERHDRSAVALQEMAEEVRALARRPSGAQPGVEAVGDQLLARLDAAATVIREELRSTLAGALQEPVMQSRQLEERLQALQALSSSVFDQVGEQVARSAEGSIGRDEASAMSSALVSLHERLAELVRSSAADRETFASRVEAVVARVGGTVNQVGAELAAHVEATAQGLRQELRAVDERTAARGPGITKADLESAFTAARTRLRFDLAADMRSVTTKVAKEQDDLRSEILMVLAKANSWLVQARDDLLARITDLAMARPKAPRALPSRGRGASQAEVEALRADIQDLQDEVAAMTRALMRATEKSRARS